jgi:hypothetical protein
MLDDRAVSADGLTKAEIMPAANDSIADIKPGSYGHALLT